MDNLNDLITALKKFPGIGSKSARRIAFYLLKQDNSELESLGTLISSLKQDLQTCDICGNISSTNPCSICTDSLRDRKTLCLLEDVEALSSFEQAGVYNGMYHILGELTNDGLTDESEKFLLKHVKSLKPDEVIVATSPKVEGDLIFYAIIEILERTKVKKISRIAFGLPFGGSIGFADKMTLHAALDSRREVK